MERRFFSGSNMSSDEDEPAPSPSAAVVARRASREAKSMREESGSDEDAEEPEDWEDDGGEASSEEDEKSLIFVNRAARGARDAQLTTLKNTTRRAHGQETQRPLAPRPRPSYDRRSSAKPTTLGAKRRVPEPLECGISVPLFADEGVVDEGVAKHTVDGPWRGLVRRPGTPGRIGLSRDDASRDHGSRSSQRSRAAGRRSGRSQQDPRSGCHSGGLAPKSTTAAWSCPRRWTRRRSTGPWILMARRSTKWAGRYPSRRSRTSGGRGGAGGADWLPGAQERGKLRGQERVDRRSGQEFGSLHRHTRTHRHAEKGDARRAVEVIAGTQLVDARDDAGAPAHPVRAHQVARATEISSKQLDSPRIIGVRLKVWRLHGDHPVPLHGDGLLRGTASESEHKVVGTMLRFISIWVEA
eukprot:scaffold8935_cov69-Phaeocystis_antarctica.AAC.8